MKKFAFLLSIFSFLCLMGTYAQHGDTATVKVSLPSGDALTSKQVYEDLKSGWSQLVATLEGPAKHTYSVYVKQYYIEGMSYMIFSVGSFLVALFFLWFTWRKSKWDEGDPKNVYSVFFIASAIMFVVSFVSVWIVFTGDTVTRAFNPEYFAIDKIVTTIIHK